MAPPSAITAETTGEEPSSSSASTAATESGTETMEKGLIQVDNIDDDDDILAQLEDEESNDYELASIREKRLMQLKKEIEQISAMKQRDHGTYTEVLREKELMDLTLKSKLCIVHFYHKEFRRCLIMDKHLKALAHTHFKTKFLKINVENAPFLVEKMQIQILPCIVSFVDGISVDRLVGFEELGFNDNFDTAMLEKRLATSGVIEAKESKVQTLKQTKSIMGRAVFDDDEESD